jgi:N-acetylglucosamine-6-phosphate deacetylase
VRLGESEAVASGDEVRLADGTLAGSVLSMDRAVANLLAFTEGRVGLAAAVRAASEVPARLLGLAGERGVIRPGAAGDVVLLDPGPPGPAVVATVIGGVVAHDRRAAGGSAGGTGDSGPGPHG